MAAILSDLRDQGDQGLAGTRIQWGEAIRWGAPGGETTTDRCHQIGFPSHWQVIHPLKCGVAQVLVLAPDARGPLRIQPPQRSKARATPGNASSRARSAVTKGTPSCWAAATNSQS
jgi:hypothetical protein